MNRTFKLVLFPVLLLAALTSPTSAEHVNVVIGKDAPRLEQFAATELARILNRAFNDISVKVQAESPSDSKHTILVGSPQTNPEIVKSDRGEWPEGDDTLVIRSLEDGTLVIGGGSPAATLWAVYEFGYLNGVRYTLSRDLFPLEKSEIKLTGYNLTARPVLRDRRFRIFSSDLGGLQSWTLEDQQKLLQQLAKLKFNGVLIEVEPWQPFVSFEFQGVKKRSATMYFAGGEFEMVKAADGSLNSAWRATPFELDGDTVGRKVFRTARQFVNPDFALDGSVDERVQSGMSFLNGLMESAHQLGMTVTLRIRRTNAGFEFKDVLPGAETNLHMYGKPATVIPKIGPADDTWADFQTVRLKSYVDSYAHADRIAWYDGNHGVASTHTVLFSIERQHFKHLRPGAERVDRKMAETEAIPQPGNCRELLLHLSPDGSSLPTSRLQALAEQVSELKEKGWRGFTVCPIRLADQDTSIRFLARAAWDGDLIARQAHDDLWQVSTQNQSAADRLWLAQQHLEKATSQLTARSRSEGFPGYGAIVRHYDDYDNRSPQPESWDEITQLYTQYMIELYRAHGAINGDGSSSTEHE